MLEYFLINFLPVFLFEIGAAIAGSLYLRQLRHPKPEVRLFVYYLWFVVVIELLGLYPALNYVTNFGAFPFIKDTLFERNYWLYNSYSIIKFIVLFIFFIRQLRKKKMRSIFYSLGGLFIVFAILNLLFSGVFFISNSAFTSIVGTLILLVLICLYYFEILKSNRILNFYKDLPFYVSVAMLFWHLVVTPLFIYSIYFTLKSPEFVSLHMIILMISNFILYGTLIAGFLVCRKNIVSKQRKVTCSQSERSGA